jgi:hypothetical protein
MTAGSLVLTHFFDASELYNPARIFRCRKFVFLLKNVKEYKPAKASL